MRLAGVFRRAVSPASRTPLSRRPPGHLAAGLAVILVLACRGDSPTGPMTDGPHTPGEPLLELTGGVGTPIFPTVPPGETQPRGDARGLNATGQVTGGAFRLPGDQNGSSEPYRWTPGGTAVRITGCCDSKVGNDINDAGTVVGNAQKDAISGARGFGVTTMTPNSSWMSRALEMTRQIGPTRFRARARNAPWSRRTSVQKHAAACGTERNSNRRRSS